MKFTRIKKRLALILMAAIVPATLAGVALATPASGAIGTILVRAGFQEAVDLKFKVQEGKSQEVIHVTDAQDTVMQQIVIAPGGTTGWHSHPGPAVALVKSGELTVYSSEDATCTGHTFVAGQGFVDSGQGHVHNARNLGNTPTEVWVTYFDVPPDESVRIDAPDPGICNF